MNNLEKQIIYSAILRLANEDEILSPAERRDVISELCRGLCDMSLDEILNRTQNNRKLRLKRGDTATNDAYTGLAGEITMDTDTGIIRVHDGETAGGVAMARAMDVADITDSLSPSYDKEIGISANTISYSDKNYLAIAGGGAGAKQSLLISRNPDMSNSIEILTLYITSAGNIYFNNQAIIPKGYYFCHNFSVLNTYPFDN